VKETLLNPETAEFFEFEQSVEEGFKLGVLTSETKKWEEIAGDWYSGRDEFVATEAAKAAKERVNSLGSAKFYSLRVKAEGKLGNKITSELECAVKDGGCECLEVR
jgi:hypothetical protein